MSKELVEFAAAYLKQISINTVDPNLKQGYNLHKRVHPQASLYEHLTQHVKSLLCEATVGFKAKRHAKTISGLIARATLNLASSLEPPPKLAQTYEDIAAFLRIQALQQYQIRQLLERAVFQKHPDLEEKLGPNFVDLSFDQTLMVWAEKIKQWQSTQVQVSQNFSTFAGDLENLGLTDAEGQAVGFLAKIQKVQPSYANQTPEEMLLYLRMVFEPALEMFRLIKQATTPAQIVHHWCEAVVLSCNLIRSVLGGEPDAVGGPDKPAITLCLVCFSGIEDDIVYRFKLARLFCVDDSEAEEYNLPPWAKTDSASDQFVFNAETRSILPTHQLVWAEDIIALITEEVEDQEFSAAGVTELMASFPGLETEEAEQLLRQNRGNIGKAGSSIVIAGGVHDWRNQQDREVGQRLREDLARISTMKESK